jgi:cupin fold WbuC family metalloprotein
MVKFITDDTLKELTQQARQSPRLRMNYNLHAELDDPVQRLCIDFEPGTYVRPHRHPQRWECLFILSGSALLLIFDDDGEVVQRATLSTEGPVHGLELPANTWHTLAGLESGTVLFEVKQGPYIKPDEKDFAAWAPAEGDEAVPRFSEWFLQTSVGDHPPSVT